MKDPERQTVRYPICPVCGQECERIYRDSYGNIFGCDECVEERDAWQDADAMERRCDA